MIVAFIRTESAAALPEHAVAQEISSDEVLIRFPIGSRPRACARVARTMPTRTDHVTLTRGAAALAAVANTLAVATSSPAMPQRDGRAALWPMSR
jgi:hypothetical protein